MAAVIRQRPDKAGPVGLRPRAGDRLNCRPLGFGRRTVVRSGSLGCRLLKAGRLAFRRGHPLQLGQRRLGGPSRPSDLVRPGPLPRQFTRGLRAAAAAAPRRRPPAAWRSAASFAWSFTRSTFSPCRSRALAHFSANSAFAKPSRICSVLRFSTATVSRSERSGRSAASSNLAASLRSRWNSRSASSTSPLTPQLASAARPPGRP